MPSQQPASTVNIWDVVIIGAGPAGSAVAITLAKLGQSVLLVDEQVTAKYKLGESLAPVSIDIVRHFLGDIEAPNQNTLGLCKTAGNISVWASEQPDQKDFFFSTTGYGLCIDRLAFDGALRLRAEAEGACLKRGLSFRSCSPVSDQPYQWILEFHANDVTDQYHARYIVDCSGRRATLAKSLNIPMTENEDQLFAYAQWFSLDDGGFDDDSYTHIEAVSNGWWYTNRIPSSQGVGSKRLVIFHSDRDLPAAKMAGSAEGFARLLEDAPLINSLIASKGYMPSGVIRGAPANSQRLQDFCGDNWMAVGDAAQAYDPLSSQGIDKALRTGSEAGHLIHYALSESLPTETLNINNSYIRQYANHQQKLWEEYLTQRDYYYGIQERWGEQLFWKRRKANKQEEW